MVDLEKIKDRRYPTREEMRKAIYDLIAEVEELREKVKQNSNPFSVSYPPGSRYGIIKRKNLTSQFS